MSEVVDGKFEEVKEPAVDISPVEEEPKKEEQDERPLRITSSEEGPVSKGIYVNRDVLVDNLLNNDDIGQMKVEEFRKILQVINDISFILIDQA